MRSLLCSASLTQRLHISTATQMGCTLLFIRAMLTLIWLCMCSICQTEVEEKSRRSGRLSVWPAAATWRSDSVFFFLCSSAPLGFQCFLLCMSVITSIVNALARNTGWTFPKMWAEGLFAFLKCITLHWVWLILYWWQVPTFSLGNWSSWMVVVAIYLLTPTIFSKLSTVI